MFHYLKLGCAMFDEKCIMSEDSTTRDSSFLSYPTLPTFLRDGKVVAAQIKTAAALHIKVSLVSYSNNKS